jgi:hypothetical protein
MNILVTGSGTSGSWQIRGVQLGAAIGATVQPNAGDDVIRGHDLAIVVKRPPADLVQRIQRAGVPLVWDVVDAWPQPQGNSWTQAECQAWLRQQVATIRPAAIVAATNIMAVDCQAFGVPSACMLHHARPGQPRTPIREQVRTVGYEGGNYLGRWLAVLQRQCARRGWQFVVNPPEGLQALDIVVALREAQGYATLCWKSNVKLANAQGSGTPFIGALESGYIGACSPAGAERFATSEYDLAKAFDELTPHAARMQAAEGLFRNHPRLDIVARQYTTWLREVVLPQLKAAA